MRIDFNSKTALFEQIARAIEDGVLSGVYEEETQVPSTTELSTALKINPATVLKGINMLTDQEILYKKRGIGMFVQKGAQEKVAYKRKEEFYGEFVVKLVEEAAKLNITKAELIAMIERGGESK